jgi:hypothetical protein
MGVVGCFLLNLMMDLVDLLVDGGDLLMKSS